MLATGNVFLRQNGTELLADEVTYDQEPDKAVARGNVFMTSEDGTERRADFMTLDTAFTHIVAENLRMRFKDGSFLVPMKVTPRLATVPFSRGPALAPAVTSKRGGPNWDVRATSSTHNEKTQTITRMSHARLNVPLYICPIWRIRTGLLGDAQGS